MTAAYFGCVLLGVLATLAVLLATPPQPARRSLVWCFVLTTLWAATDLASNLATHPAEMRAIAVIAAPIWAFLPYAILNAALRYARITWPLTEPALHVALALPAFGAMGLELGGLLHSEHIPAHLAGGYFDSVATPWQHAVTAYFLAYIIAAGTILARPGRRVQEAELRATATAILGGVLPATVIGGFANGGGTLHGWRPPYLGAVVGVGVAAGLAVAMLKRHIFEPLEAARSARDDAEARYRALVDLAPTALLVTDAQGRITDGNARGAGLLGFEDVASLVAGGRELVAWLRERDRPAGRAAVARLAAGGTQDGKRTLVRQRGGAVVPLAVSAAPLTDPAGGTTHILWAAQDLTLLEREAAQRRDLEGEVARAQRLESLGVLAGGIAHDFNNLLAGILGNAELAREDVAEGHPAEESLEQIVKASQRAADLVRAMLAYAGRGKLEIRPLDLSALVREIAELLALSTSKKVTLRQVLAGDLPAVEGDPGQLQQIVMNLIRNAAEAIGDAVGEVRVETRAEAIAAGAFTDAITGESVPAGDYVVLEVADTGAGIAPEVLPNIFDPFFSTKASGRGLGLSAGLGIVRSHGGALAIDTAPGEGTTFVVLFPAGPTAALARTAAAAPATGPPGERGEGAAPRTVLVVDDEEAVRKVAERVLTRAGFEVLLATDGLDGVAVFEREADRIDLVLLDLTMPGLSGEEVLDRIRGRAPKLPVILASGYGRVPPRDEATSFLGKPFPPATLVNAAQRALRAQQGP